jgi:hypothetical protein
LPDKLSLKIIWKKINKYDQENSEKEMQKGDEEG